MIENPPKQECTREVIIDRLAEIHKILLTESVTIGGMPQSQQNQVGAIVGDAIKAMQNGHVQ